MRISDWSSDVCSSDLWALIEILALLPGSVLLTPSGHGSRTHEFEQVRIEFVRMGGEHSMGISLVDLQRPVRKQLNLLQRGACVRNDLVVVALHDERRDRNRPQVFRLVRLGECLDAFIMCQCASHHSLAPPVLDGCLRDFRSRPVEPIEWPRRDSQEKLCAIGSKCGSESVEHGNRSAVRIGVALDHYRRYGSYQNRFGNASLWFPMPCDVARQLTSARRMPDADRVKSEQRRVGREWLRTCRYRSSPHYEKKK